MPAFCSKRGPIPPAAGIGLRGPHHARFLADARPPARWLEAHSENYFAEHGVAAAALEFVRAHYPLSLHGVGLSLGSVDPLSETHLARLRRLVDRIEPGLVSEHLSWGSVGGRHLNDLLPLPYTPEALAHVVPRIQAIQERLRRPILVENVSSYVEFRCSTMPEWEFLVAAARQSGCGILLDVNNVYVSARNHGFSAEAYIEAIPPGLVAEIHIAGHRTQRHGGSTLWVDTHDAPVCADVWALYRAAVRRFGAVPTLIEWDSELPPVERVLEEANRAQRFLDEAHACAA